MMHPDPAQGQAAPVNAAGDLLVEGATVIDGTGAPPAEGLTILVINGWIDYVGAPTPTTASWTGPRVDAAGQTAIPGLFDLHIHTTLEADMRSYLLNGVMTVRFGGIDSPSVAELRHRLSVMRRLAPRILNLGPMLDSAPPSWPRWARVVADPEDARRVATELVRAGELDGLFFVQGLTPETLAPVVEVAHEHGLPVVGQSWLADGLDCAELGVDQLDNTSRIVASRSVSDVRLRRAGPVPDRLALLARAWTHVDWDLTMPILEAMAEQGVAYCPTLVITEYLAGIGRADLERDRHYVQFGEADHVVFNELADQMNGTWSAEDDYYWKASLDNRYEWIRRFHELGGIVLPGTDMQYGGIQLHRELANLERCGLSRLDVITAATGTAARVAGISESVGLIQPRRRADFVILRADPLEALANLRAIDLVVQGGVPLRPEQISRIDLGVAV